MKIQSLAIMFIILILPISLVLSSYIATRIETLSLQSNYDSKLNDATYDALKAYQLNSLSSDTSDYTNSKMRDIQASVNTFFNTISSSFSTLGYTKETLQNFVPALVYTMYDGYYIYSPYTNTWDDETSVIQLAIHGTDTTYKDRENIHGLKPYVYYSCRYSDRSTYDITITYSLDNYIQIQGYVTDGGERKTVSRYGYVLSGVEIDDETGVVTYKGITIDNEQALEEKICYTDIDKIYKEKTCKYLKKNGTKYYTDGSKVFSVLNGNAIVQAISISEIQNNTNAIEYYKEAYELKKFIDKYLPNLSTNNIVGIEGTENKYYSIRKYI